MLSVRRPVEPPPQTIIPARVQNRVRGRETVMTPAKPHSRTSM